MTRCSTALLTNGPAGSEGSTMSGAPEGSFWCSASVAPRAGNDRSSPPAPRRGARVQPRRKLLDNGEVVVPGAYAQLSDVSRMSERTPPEADEQARRALMRALQSSHA